MQKLNIKTNESISRTIYAYITPDNRKTDGYVKIGQTTRDADTRIKEQVGTVQLDVDKLWEREARFNGGGYFTDKEFHQYLRLHGYKSLGASEWFYFGDNPEEAENMLMKFTFKKYNDTQKDSTSEYVLRDEQDMAVNMALDYSRENLEGEFLWNAKPRFGKTLSAYHLVQKMDARNVLIVTNRPAIANSWFDDFNEFIGWQTDYKFVSESDSLKDKNTLTRDNWVKHAMNNKDARQINFISLQDLKGSHYHGGSHDKLKWVSDIQWDMLIIDEAHEGIDTFKTDVAFDNISRNFTLHLSGTPFKAIAGGKFDRDAIYNWSYQDEQEMKNNWNDDNVDNPYAELPQLNMYTYQMSHMIADEINKGATIDGNDYDYAFDLNEFFATDRSGKFEHEDDVRKWLDTLTSNEKYPFSTPELRNELNHTFWILHRVASAKALAKMLNEHPVFENYEIVIAAGDGKSDESDMKANENSLNRVRSAIKNNGKTITLSVGQLTTGVTIPEWSAVLMLSNMESPALYMQAAFRAQNPHQWEDTETATLYQKNNAYVFDFAPERTLIIFDEFANNLNTHTTSGGGTMKDREENIRKLLNFFPVIGEDMNGEMIELDYRDVLTIPQQIKSAEVVKRGFMSNLLFANISGIFNAPQVVLDTLDELNPESNGRIRETKKKVDTDGVEVDENGDIKVDNEIIVNKSKGILGNKVLKIKEPPVNNKDSAKNNAKRLAKEIVESEPLREIIENTRKELKTTKSHMNKEKRLLNSQLENKIHHVLARTANSRHSIQKEHERALKNATTDKDIKSTNEMFNERMYELELTEANEIERVKEETIVKWNQSSIEGVERNEKETAKNTVEEDVRSRLRGFARTIPSFLMAYGNADLTLENFDEYVPNHVFKEVTGITIDQFTFLRDGGEYEEEGEIKHFNGRLFDEGVFNESIKEFLNKKKELSNYFEDYGEDIFDYIPPQQTNQIFTPKNVVIMMVDALEEENPNIYDDSSKTFIDIYMKSGLYITEIVRRLYNSDVIKAEYPDDDERVKHILENQVYGFAPSEIIYNIATNFIFDGRAEDISRKNFHQIDVTPHVQEGKLQEVIDELYGDMK